MSTRIAGLALFWLIFPASLLADITWTGDGDGSSVRNSSSNWNPATSRPNIGENFLLPTDATTTSITLNDNRDYGNIIVDGKGSIGSVFTVETNQTNRDGGTGIIGSTNGGILRITGVEFVVGRTSGS